MSNNWKSNFAVIIVSAVIAVYALEFVLWFIHYNPQLAPKELLLRAKKSYDTRSKFEVIEDLRSEGIDAWPTVLPTLFIKSDGLLSEGMRIFPLGGISLKSVIYCNECGQYSVFENDEHGFNNPKGLHRKSGIKAVLVGDSFTHGACVMTGEDIASHMRNSGINALNLGNGGNGPLLELATLKEYAEPLRPEIVIWVYFEGNDLINLEYERKSSMLMSYLEDDYSQNLRSQQDAIDAVLIKHVNSQHDKKRLGLKSDGPDQAAGNNRGFRSIAKLWHLRSRLGLIGNPTRKSIADEFEHLSEILATANQRVSGWGGVLYFVYLPDLNRYANYRNKGSLHYRDDVLTIVRQLGIPLIDFNEKLDEHPDPLSISPFHKGRHYSADGYKMVSAYILKRLREDKRISIER